MRTGMVLLVAIVELWLGQHPLSKPLTEADVRAALEAGSGKQREFAIVVSPGLAAPSSGPDDFKIANLKIFTPARWLAHKRASTALEWRQFSQKNVTPAMTTGWVVWAASPGSESGKLDRSGSVVSVTLRSRDGAIKVPPRRQEDDDGSRSYSWGMEAKPTAPVVRFGKLAYFESEDFEKVAGPNLDQEFHVSVGYRQAAWTQYVVTRKHLEELRAPLQ